MAIGIARNTSSTMIGTITVSVAGRRETKMLDTGSRVIQLWPKSKLKTCFRKTPSCTHQGWSSPSWLRIASICCLSATWPARTSAGSPPKNLNRKNTSRITPPSVGSICQIRRTR